MIRPSASPSGHPSRAARPPSTATPATAREGWPAGDALGRIIQNVGQDRKSTRLNSSHVARSYAVFCLKKKEENFEDHPLDGMTCSRPTHCRVLFVGLFNHIRNASCFTYVCSETDRLGALRGGCFPWWL